MARRATSSTKPRTPHQEIAPAEPAPAKTTRRGSKPKPPTAAEEMSQITGTPMDALPAEADEQVVDSGSSSLASADAQAASPAAQWNAETGRASFDWPIIEAVAATSGPNQAMAKLLLAARAEGANSRWPF